jgi:hypothetical protein
MQIVFSSGRNVYVVEEPFYFHSTSINLITEEVVPHAGL